MNREIQLAVRAITDVYRERLHTLKTLVDRKEIPSITVQPARLPDTQVTNQVATPTVTVQVDMTEVAKALDKLGEVLSNLVEMNSQLLQVISSMPSPSVENNIEVQPTEIGDITVKADVTLPQRKARRIKIRHGEKESIITEE